MKSPRPLSSTAYGQAWCGNSLELIDRLDDESVNLVMTSPPFPLLRPKAYGNEDQSGYVDWLAGFAEKIMPKLATDGSFVIDLGGACQRGTPSRSLHIYKVVLRLCEDLGYHLCQEFYWHNTAKLPSPIEWVYRRKIRAKDAVNTILWLGKSPWPKANVRNVLTPYSERMRKLLAETDTRSEEAVRPSGHSMTRTIARDNGGAIPSNVLEIPNTSSNDAYLRRCKRLGVILHPARYPRLFPEFFIRMLTAPGDLVVDIFARSNTTGEAAERLQRRWISFEMNREYVASSALRFSADACDDELRSSYMALLEASELALTGMPSAPTDGPRCRLAGDCSVGADLERVAVGFNP